MFSLINNSWLPVLRRRSGAVWIRPAQITENIAADPVIAIDWPRADFRLAALEFCIGLLAVAYPPRNRKAWEAAYRTPPTTEELDATFAPLAHAFDLDGDGPRFMQDFEELVAESNDVATLLIEAPGEQALKKNTDLLNKRGQVARLSRPAAAMALFTLQTYAPAGGAGNRTGLRGGGPLTTLAIPPGDVPLWHLLWANVPLGDAVEPEEMPHIFPWLTKTRTSENDRKVAPAEDYDRLAFWGMPRRIRLDFSAVAPGEVCDLTGLEDGVMLRGWRQRPYGANYEAFRHPLSPYYKPKPKEQLFLPVHPQPAGIGYRDFLGLILADPEESLRPAACIMDYRRFRQSVAGKEWRILAAGFDMDNMKARGFVETEMPAFEGDNPVLQDEIQRQLIAGAKEVENLLRRAVRNALFSDGAKVDIAASLFNTLRARFWQESESAFFAQASRAAAGTAREDVAGAFLGELRALSLRLFNETAPITESDHPQRVAQAAKFLGMALYGYGTQGNALHAALGLVLREAKPKRKQA